MSDSSPDKKFKLRLEMKSDWYIGTGAGIPGSVDALLARDGDGFPCVPAKTIVGIWRDALETLAYGLDSGVVKGKWQSWVAVIFGSQPNIDKIPTDKPRPSILSMQPARLDENLRAVIKGDAQLEQALTFIKPNTRIDAASGTAETDSLRFTEMGRIGTVLEAEFNLNFDVLENITVEQKELIWALLVASASLVERIGGNRRRGSGKCEMQVVGGASKEKAVEILRNTKPGNLESVPPVVVGGSASDGDIADTAQNLTTPINHSAEQMAKNNDPLESISTSDWQKIKYSLTLHTPVAIVTNTLGNVSETLDFIPGTYLLPHITKQLKGISKYVAAGDFQVLPATIEVNGERGLPVPKVIHYDKVEGGFDKAKTVYNRLQESIEGGEQKKNYREGYLSSLEENNKELPSYETTKKILLMHNTVRDDIQRPDETVGGVFSRQAIKAGTVLRGEIHFNKSIEDKVKSLESYESYVRLGTSKKDDYGLAELTFETLEDGTSNATADNKLIVYLESDVLFRNSNLRQTNLVDELKVFFEKELSVSLQEEEEDSLIQVRRIESWHEGWGLPRPTLTAMAAGSVVVFEIIGTIDENKLKKLELSSIGERRGEGYGQVRFNPPILTRPINDWKVSQKVEESRTESSSILSNAEPCFEFARQIEKTAYRKAIENKVLVLTGNYTWREDKLGWTIKGVENENTKQKAKETKPNSSQAGSLRSVLQNLQKPKDEKVISWLDHLEQTSNRKEKWTNESLKNLRQIVNEDNKVWELLGNDFPQEKTENSKNELRTELWAEAVKSLLDACARAHKRDTEDK